MARIYDNIDIKFTDGLRGIIENTGVKRVDFCVGYFNLRGWNLIVEQVDKLPGGYVYEDDKRRMRYCRLLIGMHRPDEDLIRRLYSRQETMPDAEYVQRCKRQIAQDFRNLLLLGLPSAADEKTLRRLSVQLKEGKVCVKLYLKEPLHAKLYLAHRPDDNFNKIQAIMGSSNLTYAGLTKQGELNAEFADSDSAEKLAQWFDDRWNERFCLDITEELARIIDESWAGDRAIPPYYIYLKTAYHLSQEARSGIKEFTLPPEFRRDLFDFQQTAVKIAAKNLNNDKRGGAMIGDVVGLGKTITACAIAKLYEMAFASSTLIICPANLQDMWRKYIRKYDLKAEVWSMARAIDVDSARYYRLIIVDESSMIDMWLARQFFQRIRPGTRVILVGDVDQLQSVGAGDVFRELIDSGLIPVTVLNEIFRQKKGSIIAYNAKRINEANIDLQYGEDFQFVKCQTQEEAADLICRIFCEQVAIHGIEKVQILSPFRSEGSASVEQLNATIREIVNPVKDEIPDLKIGSCYFRQGDKVMQTKNNAKASNGDIGYIRKMGRNEENEMMVTIEFSGNRTVEYGMEEMAHMELAYATTVHKAMGSEFDIVIMPVLRSHYIMLNRNIVYTAITRAKEQVIPVGQKKALVMAILKKTTGKRNTLLGERIGKYLKAFARQNELKKVS